MKLPSDLRDRLHARLPQAITDLRALAREHTPEALAQREAGYQIRNAADEAIVRIYDEIWWLGINAQDFTRDLDGINAAAMRVEINSPGGDVFDGIAIYNALRNHPAYVTTRVDGLAASIASVIAQAGDVRQMQPSGQMMIHNAWGMVVGDTRDHAEMADLLEMQDGVIAGIYASRSGRDADGFRDLMNAETWLTAERAVAEGLADVVVEPPTKNAPDAKARLVDQISETVVAVEDVIISAERVAALRADAGKGLSNVNRESLDGLRGALARLDGLLTPTVEPEPQASAGEVWTEADLAVIRARIHAAERVLDPLTL